MKFNLGVAFLTLARTEGIMRPLRDAALVAIQHDGSPTSRARLALRHGARRVHAADGRRHGVDDRTLHVEP